MNIDGGNITDQVVSTRDTLGASLGEVKEFQIITNNYNAEYGQAGSLIINVVMEIGDQRLPWDRIRRLPRAQSGRFELFL